MQIALGIVIFCFLSTGNAEETPAPAPEQPVQLEKADPQAQASREPARKKRKKRKKKRHHRRHHW